MNGTLLQVLVPRDRLRGIHDRFAEGGTWGEVVFALVGIAAFVAFLHLAFGAQRRYRRSIMNNPRRLFRSLIVQLDLTVRQRDLLRRMAGELRLEHPTLLLLAPSTFWTHADRWLDGSRRRSPHVRQELEKLSRVLFRDSHSGREDEKGAAVVA